MKTVLFLGAARFQMPPMEYALEAGYRVLSCDNRPENPGHALAEKSFCVSTTDVEGVLRLAETEAIDGILTFGSDVSALTAALVAEKLHLPGPPPQTIQTLTDKFLFRSMLDSHGIQALPFYQITNDSLEEVSRAMILQGGHWILKPVDASGSKGVQVLASHELTPEIIHKGMRYALEFSRSQRAIVERFHQRSGPQVCGDGFFINGKLAFIEFGDGWFYANGQSWAPYGETFPSTHSPESLTKLSLLIEKSLQAAGFRDGPFNQDSFILEDGSPFLVEVGPRCGGNYLPSAIRRHTGVDLIAASVDACLGKRVSLNKESHVFRPEGVACYMVHSHQKGRFAGLKLSDEVKPFVREVNLYAQEGDRVEPFVNGSHSLANLVLEFPNTALMHQVFQNASVHFEALVKNEEALP